MEEISRNPATHSFLEEILPSFEVCARRAVEGVLDVPTQAPRGFKLTPSLSNSSSLCCIIQCWNADYTGILSVGVNKTDLEELVPGASGDEMALDALGEVANVMAARVLCIRGFSDHFGFMAISPPLFSNGGVTSAKAGSVQGTLLAKTARMFFGFAIMLNEKEML